jgi:hypothetical protein
VQRINSNIWKCKGLVLRDYYCMQYILSWIASRKRILHNYLAGLMLVLSPFVAKLHFKCSSRSVGTHANFDVLQCVCMLCCFLSGSFLE